MASLGQTNKKNMFPVAFFFSSLLIFHLIDKKTAMQSFLSTEQEEIHTKTMS